MNKHILVNRATNYFDINEMNNMDQSNTQRRPAKHLNRSNMVNMQNLTQHQQYHWNLKEDDVQQQTNQKDFHVGQP